MFMHPIETVLNYRFQDPTLLNRALTHPSASTQHYQRLEFLGDRVLGLMVADWLLRQHDLPEGTMAQWLSELTSKAHLARVGLLWGLLPHIQTHLSKEHEKKSTQTLLGDVLEALIGAVFLDSSYPETCNIFLTRVIDENVWKKGERHAKNELQEWTQKHSQTLPTYTVVSENSKGFKVRCTVEGYPSTHGVALQKRTAELQAAQSMLQQIGV